MKPSLDTSTAAALDAHNWNVSRAAAQLGIARSTLQARIARAGLPMRGGAPSKPSSKPSKARAPVSAVPAPSKLWDMMGFGSSSSARAAASLGHDVTGRSVALLGPAGLERYGTVRELNAAEVVVVHRGVRSVFGLGLGECLESERGQMRGWVVDPASLAEIAPEAR